MTKNSRSDIVARVLASLDREQLDAFISRECDRDTTFRDRFLALGAGSVVKVSPKTYRQRIQRIIDEYADDFGYIHDYYNDYDDDNGFDEKINEILDEARNAIRDKKWNVAIAALKGMTESFDIITESIYGFSDVEDVGIYVDCFNLWRELADSDIPRKVRAGIVSYMLSLYDNEVFCDSDLWWTWIDTAIAFADTPELLKSVSDILDSHWPESEINDDTEYDADHEEAMKYRLKIMEKISVDRSAIRDYLRRHVGNPRFRDILIGLSWEEGDYGEALRLALEGERRDASKPGIARKWLGWELKIYRRLNDKEQILRLARYFFCSSGLGAEYSPDAMYKLMKSIVAPEEWPQWVERLLDDDNVKNSSHRKLLIYENEKMWDRYIDFLRESGCLSDLDSAPAALRKARRKEFLSLYSRLITEYFRDANSRQSYRTGAEYLRSLIRYGGKTLAHEIIETQKARRPRRPALIEELSDII